MEDGLPEALARIAALEAAMAELQGWIASAPFRGKPARRRAYIPKPRPENIEESLEEILGGERDSREYDRYWKVVNIWPSDKNPAPKRTARAWVAACKKCEPVKIYNAARNYRDQFVPPARKDDQRQFMKNPLQWLEEEGWLSEMSSETDR